MKLNFRKLFTILGVIVLVVALLLGGSATYLIRASWPQEKGVVQLSQLYDTVTVYRDRWGIPQIYANNSHDLFLAQGYLHAQDRFWQMDFWRHLGAGRLSEMFGESQLKTDRFLRTLGWARIAERELEILPAEDMASLQAYAEGVNAYLATHKGSHLSLEYPVLKVLNPNYQPEPWQPLHTLTWSKVMAWDLGENMQKEIERVILLNTLPPERVEELFPPYPAEHPVVVENFNPPNRNKYRSISPGKNQPEENSFFSDNMSLNPWKSVREKIIALNEIVGPTGSAIGSNSWVVSGEKTRSGKPLLANDPHLGVQMPSIWYENGLHCTVKSAECPYEVTGFSFPGVVGVVIGHSDRIAWGFTNAMADVMDLYVEKINPNNPDQYEVNGEWVDMEQVTETIAIAGEDPRPIVLRYTRHGPIISDTYPKLAQLGLLPGNDLPENYAIALRWNALEPARLVSAILNINRAQNWPEFRAAAQFFDIAQQNLLYADIEGNIGFQMPGKLPIRSRGDGRYPVLGWRENAAEWTDYVPFEDLPFLFNPPPGYIVNANHAIVDRDAPYSIAKDWDYGFRAKRIVEAIAESNRLFELSDFQQLQGDNTNLNAEIILPIFRSLSFSEPRLETARQLLVNWNEKNQIDRPEAALFEAFWKHLLAETFQDSLPLEYWPDGGDRWMQVVKLIRREPNSFWWDNQITSARETRDDIFENALVKAVEELEETFGPDPSQWRWGDLHPVTFRNKSLGESNIPAIEAIFNRGAFATSGGNAIVNATAWDAAKSFEVNWIPSMRIIADLSDLNASVAINSTGQSGHAFHRHYQDQIEPWRNLKYHPMASNAAATLTLIPSSHSQRH